MVARDCLGMADFSKKIQVRFIATTTLGLLIVLRAFINPIARFVNIRIADIFINVQIAMTTLILILAWYRYVNIGTGQKSPLYIRWLAFLFGLLCFDVLLLTGKYGVDSNAVNFIKTKLLSMAGVFVGIVLPFKERQRNWLVHFFLYLGLVSAFFAVVQWCGGAYFFDSMGFSSELGSEYHFDTAKDSHGHFIFRTYSIFRDHYELSAVLSLSILCTMVLLWNQMLSTQAAVVAIMFMFIGLLTTYNMTAWFSLVLAIGATYLVRILLKGIRFSPKQIVYGGIKFLIVMSIAAVIFTKLGMMDRLLKNTQMGDSSLYYRGLIFLQQIEMIMEKPMGWGLHRQDFPTFFTADNFLPYTTVLAGIPWGVSYLVIYITFIALGYRSLRYLHGMRSSEFPLALGIYGYLVYVFIGLFSNSPVLTTSYNFIFWISIGYLLSLYESKPNAVGE